MQVNVEINSKQIFENHEESESNKCTGEITYHNNGEILEFTEKYEKIELKFKITILEEKIIINRNGQTMILDLKTKNRSTLTTPYGEMNMVVLAKKIEISRQNNMIEQIHLEYEIELENGQKYDNVVEIILLPSR